MAFQSYNRQYWLSCYYTGGGRCRSRFTCPGFAISGTEWTHCWAEVFQFYRASGSGALRVGDVIGVHYPHEPRKWLSCYNNVDCGKSTCPGTPSTTHGFENQAKWTLCPGEVFKIYAQGKALNSIINEHDIIMLYYLVGNKWVNLADLIVALGSGPGTTCPPSAATYESHPTYTLEVWKQ